MLVVDILTPEMNVFSGEVTCVTLPGLDGTFQILNNHAPIISALKAWQMVGLFSIEVKLSFRIDWSLVRVHCQNADV